MPKLLNKGISTPIAIGIILLVAITVGGIFVWQYQKLVKTSKAPKSKMSKEILPPSPPQEKTGKVKEEGGEKEGNIPPSQEKTVILKGTLREITEGPTSYLELEADDGKRYDIGGLEEVVGWDVVDNFIDKEVELKGKLQAPSYFVVQEVLSSLAGCKSELFDVISKDRTLKNENFVAQNQKFYINFDLTFPQMVGLKNQTEQAKFNQAVNEFIESEIQGFTDSVKRSYKIESEEEFEKAFEKSPEYFEDSGGALGEYDLGYKMIYCDDNLLSIRFNTFEYIWHAAHPWNSFLTLNYDLQAEKVLKISDIFVTNQAFWQKLSDLAKSDLARQGYKVENFYSSGLEPREENFDIWNITPQYLIITFAHYQLASRVAGTFSVKIPLSELQMYIKPGGVLANYQNERF